MPSNYSKQTWVDDDSSYPLSAARMGVIEDGIYDAHYRPAARVWHDTNQSVGNGTFTTLVFNSESSPGFDPLGMHSTSSNTSRITVPQSGIYMVGAQVAFTPSATGDRILSFVGNGVTTFAQSATSSTLLSGTGKYAYINLVTTVQLVAGNYVEALADGGTSSINAVYLAGISPVFWVAMLSAV
jgi:hypothetical protein